MAKSDERLYVSMPKLNTGTYNTKHALMSNVCVPWVRMLVCVCLCIHTQVCACDKTNTCRETAVKAERLKTQELGNRLHLERESLRQNERVREETGKRVVSCRVVYITED